MWKNSNGMKTFSRHSIFELCTSSPLLLYKQASLFVSQYTKLVGYTKLISSKARWDSESQAQHALLCLAFTVTLHAQYGRQQNSDKAKRSQSKRDTASQEAADSWLRVSKEVLHRFTEGCEQVCVCLSVAIYLQVPPLQVQQLRTSDIMLNEDVSVLPQA